MPLSDQLKQLVELHKEAEQAMKGFIVWLWPGEALPGSYFGLVRRLVEACLRFEVIKRSVWVPVGPLLVQRCTGVNWTVRSL